MPNSASRLDRLRQIIQTQSLLTQAEMNLDRFMQCVVDNLQQLTGAKGAVVELVDGSDMLYRSASGAIAQHVGLRLKRSGSLSGLCVEKREVLRCDDSETDARVDRDACRRVGVRSMVCTPLFLSGQAVGVLKVMSEQPHGFNEEDVHTLGLMAGTLGAALGRQVAFDAVAQAEAQLRASEARMRAMLEHAHDAVVSMDSDGNITEWNSAAEKLFGWTPKEALGRSVAELVIPPAMRERHWQGMRRFMASGTRTVVDQRIELSALHRQGHELVIEISLSAVNVNGRWEFTAFMHDISERKRLEQALNDWATRDSLTGLFNRRAFLDALETAVARSHRHDHHVALLFMDMNGFKKINDEHGHAIGDEALKEFARRLLSCTRASDTVARLGGDEFTVLAEGIETPVQARALASKILAALKDPMPPGIQLHTSIGISLHRHQIDAAEFMHLADSAMYAAKHGDVPGGVVVHGEAPPP